MMQDIRFSKYTTVHKINNAWVLYNWKEHNTVEIYEEQNPLYKYFEKKDNNTDFDFNLLKDDYLKMLLDEKLVIPASIIDTENFSMEKEKYDTKNFLNLIILPSGEYCNFDCIYCYQKHVKSEFMNDQHKNAILEMIKDKKPSILSIEYFGGEPLLNINFIESLNNDIKSTELGEPGRFYSSATTNGYLLNEKNLRRLLRAGLTQFQITIDGIEEDHNFTRPLRNGKGTFSKIMENLNLLNEMSINSDIKCQVRVNFNEKSASEEKRAEVLSIFSKFSINKNFSFRFRPIANYSEINQIVKQSSSYCSRIFANPIQCQYEEEAISKGLSLADLEFYKYFGAGACYAGKPESFIISPDYSIKKCTVALNDPINNVGVLTHSGQLQLNKNWNLWVNQEFNGNSKCENCFLSFSCARNSCPSINIKNKDRICPPAKKNSEHIVKLFLENLKIEDSD